MAEEIATLAGGCFWCLDAIFRELKGVKKVVCGYAGGRTENPTYGDVCTGTTGHAETVQVTFDPEAISYKSILLVFFTMHDPTTPGRQGSDVGSQYRSIAFYHDEQQRKTIEEVEREIADARVWDRPIVTEILPFGKFYSAEDYHQDYFRKNPLQPYCMIAIRPKLGKLRKKYYDMLKK